MSSDDRPGSGLPAALATLGVERTAVVAGVPLRWYEAGDPTGTPVVLVHGIPTSPVLWRDVVPRLSGARVLSFELVGYGRGVLDGRDRDLSVEAQAVYLLALLRHLELPPAVLVGHDLGGGVVQIAAVRDRARCAGLVVTNGICYDSWPVAPIIVSRALAPLVARTPEPLFAAQVRALLAPLHAGHVDGRAAARLHVQAFRDADGARGFARQVRALDVDDTLRVAPALPELRLPARVVWGTSDPFQKPVYGRRLARDLGAPFVGLPGIRHWTPEDAPADVASGVQAVLAEVGGR